MRNSPPGLPIVSNSATSGSLGSRSPTLGSLPLATSSVEERRLLQLSLRRAGHRQKESHGEADPFHHATPPYYFDVFGVNLRSR